MIVTDRLLVEVVLGMDKHLQTLVLAGIKRSGLIDGPRLLAAQTVNLEKHGLLIFLTHLCLAWVYLTRDAWRQNIVDWQAVAIILNIDSRQRDGTRTCIISHTVGRFKQILVLAIHGPIGAHQIEGSESQICGRCKIGHIHTDEPDGLEVGDGAFLAVVLLNRNFELIPVYLGR